MNSNIALVSNSRISFKNNEQNSQKNTQNEKQLTYFSTDTSYQSDKSTQGSNEELNVQNSQKTQTSMLEDTKQNTINKIIDFFKISTIADGISETIFNNNVKEFVERFILENDQGEKIIPKNKIEILLNNNSKLDCMISYRYGNVILEHEINGKTYGIDTQKSGSDNLIIYHDNEIKYITKFEPTSFNEYIFIDVNDNFYTFDSSSKAKSIKSNFQIINDENLIKIRNPLDRLEFKGNEESTWIYKNGNNYYKLIQHNGKHYFIRIIYINKDSYCIFSNSQGYTKYLQILNATIHKILKNPEENAIDKEYLLFVLKQIMSSANKEKINHNINSELRQLFFNYVFFMLYLRVDCGIKQGIVKNIDIYDIKTYKAILAEVLKELDRLENIEYLSYLSEIFNIMNLNKEILLDSDINQIKLIIGNYLNKTDFEEETKQTIKNAIFPKIESCLLTNKTIKFSNLARRSIVNKTQLIKNSKDFIRSIVDTNKNNGVILKDFINFKIKCNEETLVNIKTFRSDRNNTKNTLNENDTKINALYDSFWIKNELKDDIDQFKENLDQLRELTLYQSNSLNGKSFNIFNRFRSFFRNFFNIRTNSSKELLKFIKYRENYIRGIKPESDIKRVLNSFVGGIARFILRILRS